MHSSWEPDLDFEILVARLRSKKRLPTISDSLDRKIVLDATMDYRRKRSAFRRRKLHTVSLDELVESGRAEDILRTEDPQSTIQDTISPLPPKIQQILLLIYEQGMTVQEVAYHLHLSKPKVLRLANEARDLIRWNKESLR